MRIWFDLTNSPHVPFFAQMIRDLSVSNEVLITCRPLANTIDLIRMEGFAFQSIGGHGGASRLRKALEIATRVLKLAHYVRQRRPDVAISHSSFYSPPAARLLGIPSLYLNDNEHADGNRIAFRYADLVLVPEFVMRDRLPAHRGRIETYPGVKEGVYLCHHPAQRITHNGGRPAVFVRPEPATAQYYRGGTEFLDATLTALARDADVTVLPRSKEQAEHYQRLSGVAVSRDTLPLSAIVERADMFIGAGGTMTRECAVMGVPTISVYQDELLGVDKYLVGLGVMKHSPGLRPDEAIAFLSRRQRDSSCRSELLEKGRSAYKQILRSALDLGAAVMGART